MGIIRAVAGAVGGSLADSWLEYITADDMGPTTVMTKGVQVTRGKRGSNRKGTPDIISNGSRIEVGPNQMMILVDSGRIVDYTAEEGCYEVYLSSAPSMFNGELKESVRETFERFKFGGQPGKSQQVYFINLQEIRGVKFGTRNALQYFDGFYNAELFVRCHGSYSVKITDPLKFYMEVAPRNATRLDFSDLGDQFNAEFLTALQTAIGQMAVDGVRISALPSKSMELSKYMATVLDEDWTQARGMDICSVGIASISYDDESKALINMRNQGAMMSDPTIREGYVQGAIAKGLQNAGSNTAGAGQAFMAMGMGMQSAGGFMASASATNAQQMQQMQQNRAAQQPAADTWTCSCGASNTGNFCTNCGGKKPAPAGGWTCSCGAVNTGNFCTNCGSKKPEASGSWTCSCGESNTGKFCTNCGKPRN
ncbi:SPFH domain-containing protein [uncultured Ruminococcus sp.]|uniref:SPFH domain-containing protein n=1 Tax=uncultured Ruminococcus sp. TaxID=165186 RepID=UPI0026221AC2|nr:SPFH domain-containing protein [uncultured Ruminococcus sp.]